VPPDTVDPVSFPGSASLPASLLEALARSRAWGFLGDGPLEVHIAHAEGFAETAEAVPPTLDVVEGHGGVSRRWMDLGSGGGIPGLVLAHRWPDDEAVLLDGNIRRTRFLSEVVEDQGWGARVQVVNARAEEAGRMENLRGSFSLVVARSFGPPPVTAECAAPFLQRGGVLIVSEPPVPSPDGAWDEARWPEQGLAVLGLEPEAVRREPFGYRVLRQHQECPDRFPRRVGVAAKRPIYRMGDA
jgi:16S rRNA (guanine527-N7)-methyltransferase